jgi:hypothetical protein
MVSSRGCQSVVSTSQWWTGLGGTKWSGFGAVKNLCGMRASQRGPKPSNTEGEESTTLKASTKQRLLKIQKTEKI